MSPVEPAKEGNDFDPRTLLRSQYLAVYFGQKGGIHERILVNDVLLGLTDVSEENPTRRSVDIGIRLWISKGCLHLGEGPMGSAYIENTHQYRWQQGAMCLIGYSSSGRGIFDRHKRIMQLETSDWNLITGRYMLKLEYYSLDGDSLPVPKTKRKISKKNIRPLPRLDTIPSLSPDYLQ